jgi:hypothetical protein
VHLFRNRGTFPGSCGRRAIPVHCHAEFTRLQMDCGRIFLCVRFAAQRRRAEFWPYHGFTEPFNFVAITQCDYRRENLPDYSARCMHYHPFSLLDCDGSD